VRFGFQVAVDVGSAALYEVAGEALAMGAIVLASKVMRQIGESAVEQAQQ